MIVGLVCRCANSEVKFRNILISAGIERYMDVPVVIGKERCQQYIDNLPDGIRNDSYTRALSSLVGREAGYIAVVGYDEDTEQLRWSDVYHNNLEAKGLAEVIIETFA